MLLIQTSDENFTWLAPYAYLIVLLGFGFFLFRVFENWYADRYDRPFFRHYWVYRKLKPAQLSVIENEFEFYSKLTKKERLQFQHRLSRFLAEKKFIARGEIVLTDRMKVLIGAVGCMVSFGRKNYEYDLIDYILIYPEEFFSNINDSYHKGEFNPRERALVLSWKHFEKGYKISNDKLNLGIHEFMHAMQLESKQSRDIDSNRFSKQFQNILKQLTDDEVRARLDETKFFRNYAFTNQYEFMAVLAEYFFEAPEELENQFPVIYEATQKLLNFRYAGY